MISNSISSCNTSHFAWSLLYHCAFYSHQS